MSDDRNIAQRHRFGTDCAGPVTLRDFMRDANWSAIAVLMALAGFWCWVGYHVALWWPW